MLLYVLQNWPRDSRRVFLQAYTQRTVNMFTSNQVIVFLTLGCIRSRLDTIYQSDVKHKKHKIQYVWNKFLYDFFLPTYCEIYVFYGFSLFLNYNCLCWRKKNHKYKPNKSIENIELWVYLRRLQLLKPIFLYKNTDW